MSVKPPAQPVPIMKNALTAPLIYFDNAPVRGSFNGNIEVELTTRYMQPKADGNVSVDMVCVAHLRCTPQSAALLIDSLQYGLRIYQEQLEKPSDMLSN
jgi:hypothetical protein